LRRCHDPHEAAIGYFVNGLIALALSLVIWRLTHNFLGWAVLFLPGSALVIWGLVTSLRR
jgi:hypothetical protein